MTGARKVNLYKQAKNKPKAELWMGVKKIMTNTLCIQKKIHQAALIQIQPGIKILSSLESD